MAEMEDAPASNSGNDVGSTPTRGTIIITIPFDNWYSFNSNIFDHLNVFLKEGTRLVFKNGKLKLIDGIPAMEYASKIRKAGLAKR